MKNLKKILERFNMDNLETPNQYLKQTQLKIIETYLDRISQMYKSLPDKERKELVYGLEKLIDLIEGNTPLKPVKSKTKKH